MRALVAALPDGALRTGAGVTGIVRDPFGVTIATAAGRERFDAVVLATHADDALRLLVDADAREAGSSAHSSTPPTRWCCTRTSGSCRPNPRARASWNVSVGDCRRPGDALVMTYHMNRLQSLPGAIQYCVSLNPGDTVRPERVILERAFSHPMYTFRTLDAQAGLRGLQGRTAPGSRAPISATGSTRTAAGRASRRPTMIRDADVEVAA